MRAAQGRLLARPCANALYVLAVLQRGALCIIAYVGLVISTMPYLVPPAITVWDAAAAPSSQRFVLIGIAILMPFILGYTVFVYYTFRGKVRADEGYH